MNDKLSQYFNKYRQNINSPTIIVCSKKLKNLKGKLIQQFEVKMTWHSNSVVYVYEMDSSIDEVTI